MKGHLYIFVKAMTHFCRQCKVLTPHTFTFVEGPGETYDAPRAAWLFVIYCNKCEKTEQAMWVSVEAVDGTKAYNLTAGDMDNLPF